MKSLPVAVIGRGTAGQTAAVLLWRDAHRVLTPLFQSDRDLLAKLGDVAFLPLGKRPGGRGHTLRVLGATQHGAFGKLPCRTNSSPR